MAGSTTSAPMMNQGNADKVTATEGSAGAISVFNDAIRDGLKGSVFDVKSKGYINGAYAANAVIDVMEKNKLIPKFIKLRRLI